LNEFFSFTDEDYIICADGGYHFAKAEGIRPHIVIGDFDSMKEEISDSCEVLRLQPEKDDTDTLVCLNYGIEKGFHDFVILGGLGGRLDHTVANLQTLSYAVDRKLNVWIIDGKNRATMIDPGSISIPKETGTKISLFAFSDTCEGVTITGVKYPLDDHRLTRSFPLGISNEFITERAFIGLKTGRLLIILSKD
jgi:thiamine pyrophosphokinase